MATVWDAWESAISSPDPDPLQVIGLAARYHRYLSAVENRAVATARASGASWQEIADAAGTTRQSAWEKWKSVQRLTEGAPDRFSRSVLDVERQTLADMMEWLKEHRSA